MGETTERDPRAVAAAKDYMTTELKKFGRRDVFGVTGVVKKNHILDSLNANTQQLFGVQLTQEEFIDIATQQLKNTKQ